MKFIDILPNLNAKIRNFGKLNSEEAVYFFNDAISYLNEFLISINDQSMLKQVTVADGIAVPNDWSGKTDGEYAFNIADGKFVVKSLFKPCFKVNYYANKPLIKGLEESFPFNDNLISVAVLIASIYVLNRSEGDIAADNELLFDRLTYISNARCS